MIIWRDALKDPKWDVGFQNDCRVLFDMGLKEHHSGLVAALFVAWRYRQRPRYIRHALQAWRDGRSARAMNDRRL